MPRPLETRAGQLASLCCLLLWGLFPAKPGAAEIYQEKSLYRNILVYEEQGQRCMRFGVHDNGRQSCISLTEPDKLVFNYTKMLLGALYLNPSPARVLIIGLGGGSLPMTLQKILPQASIDCVEIDPSVVKVARQFFGFRPARENSVFVEDGRVFVKRAAKQHRQYDLIVLDAFDQTYIPEHMTTKEYLLEVRSLLAPEGVVAANTFSGSRLFDSESATYAAAFGPFYNLQLNNRVILTRNGERPPIAQISQNAQLLDDRLSRFGASKEWLLPLFSTTVEWPADTRLLTDQYSPANLLNQKP